MNKVSSLLVATTALVLGTGSAQAQWYMGADAGVTFLEDADISGRDNTGSTWTDTSGNKAGYGLQAHGGYDFGGPRLEAEVAYRGSSLDSLAKVTQKVSGDTSALSFMTNGVYQFMPNSNWHPFIGAGIGVARVNAEWKVNGERVLNDSEWTFAYQGFAGVAYDIDKNGRSTPNIATLRLATSNLPTPMVARAPSAITTTRSWLGSRTSSASNPASIKKKGADRGPPPIFAPITRP